MCIGISILLPTLVLMYIDFFVPKLGPLGTGERHFTVYATMTNGLILGLGFTILGIIIWKKPNLFK